MKSNSEYNFNGIDKIISIFSPEKALKRLAARKSLSIINSGYSEGGASYRKKSLKGWTANSRAPTEDIDENLQTLRNRSRDLYMNAPIAKSSIITTRTNVIGSGLRLKPILNTKLLKITEQEAEEIKEKIQLEFSLWAEDKRCDACGMNNFYELQQLAQISWLMSGDCFTLLKYANRNQFFPYGLRIHLIEADRVCCRNNAVYDTFGNNKIFSGVEINPDGCVVAYWICNRHPNSYYINEPLEWTRVPVYGQKSGRINILHLMEAERPEQHRGVPFLAAVIEPLKQLTRYTEAELMAAVISSMFTVFIKTDSPDTSTNQFGSMLEEEEKVSDSERNYEMGVGAINILGENESIEIADPKRPSTSFEAFINSLAKSIGASLEIPTELLLKSFNSSYSASRAALLEAWKMFKMRRSWITNDFCQPIYEQWLAESVALGRIKLKGFFDDPIIKKAWCNAEWYGPAQGQIDPVKEVNAAKTRVEQGFSTREKEAMELNGTDFNSNAKQLKKENSMLVE